MNIVNKNIELPVIDYSGKEVGTAKLASELFGVEPNPYCVQLAVKVDLANRRQATAKTRTISEVNGTGKKPWKQKGTGRARVGTHRSPLWRGGAVVFGPNGKQSYKIKMNKKEHFLALASVLSDKATEKKITILDSEKFSSPKTKDFVKALAAMKITGKTLFVVDQFDENFFRAASNIPSLKIVLSDNISVYDVLNAANLVLTKSVINDIDGQCEEASEEAK
jgi:large subunit ribosomal protein L4